MASRYYRKLNPQQRKLATRLVKVGQKVGATDREIKAALLTARVEANFSNPAGGHGTSQGWRQEISTYGSSARRRNVKGAAKRFYSEAKGMRGRKLKSGALAQAVQRSAYPGRYAQHGKEGQALLKDLTGKSSTDRKSTRKGNRRVTVETKRTTIPGQDFSQQRKQAKLSYLQSRGDPSALLGLASSLRELKDVAPVTKVSRSKDIDMLRAKRAAKGGSSKVQQMERIARAVDKRKLPYKWGGGHGSSPAPIGTPVDCSGFVSQVLGISPRVSGALASYGRPGRGKNVTIYANSGHVLIEINGQFYATSKSNPGGGAGKIARPTRAYLSKFSVRHPKGL